jgi:hypothetical protein
VQDAGQGDLQRVRRISAEGMHDLAHERLLCEELEHGVGVHALQHETDEDDHQQARVRGETVAVRGTLPVYLLALLNHCIQCLAGQIHFLKDILAVLHGCPRHGQKQSQGSVDKLRVA